MVDLYGLVATQATRMDCAYTRAHENAIAAGDAEETSAPPVQAWGMGAWADETVETRLQRHPKPFSRTSREQAQAGLASLVLAWCQVGRSEPSLQPMVEGASLAVVDAHVPGDSLVCEDIRSALRPRRQKALDSDGLAEHVFQLLLERRDQMPGRAPVDTLRAVMTNVRRWSEKAVAEASAGDGMQTPMLRVLWSSGTERGLVGCSIGAPLWVVRRTRPLVCEYCGQSHAVRVSEGEDYRAVVLASTPRTDEDWQRLPDGAAFSITPDAQWSEVAT